MQRHRHWLTLIGVQILVSVVLFAEFFSGAKYFAYTDIGSDTYFQFVPEMMHLADYLRSADPKGWSFNIGLGAPFPLPWNPFDWLSIAGGAEGVLGLRIWVYVAKLLIGGWAFHAFLRRLPIAPSAAVIGAVAYTFCGYALVNGQWDSHASELAVYPLVLWAFAHRLQGGSRYLLPAITAFAIVMSCIIVVSLCVFAALCFILSVLVTEQRLAHAAAWLRNVAPFFVLGLLLAAPVLLPGSIQVLDSPRISGPQALFAQRLAELFSVNDGNLILAQIAGLFHKDLLGIGNDHLGWMNYLESPGFYVGTLALLLIPQLWKGEAILRRALLVGLGFIVLYFVFPATRYLAFGFAAQYFRISTLWVSMILLVLSVLALDLIMRQGIHKGLLGGAAVFALGTPVAFLTLSPHMISADHVAYLLVFTGMGVSILGVVAIRRTPAPWLPWALLLLVSSEAMAIGHPSYHRGRIAVTEQTHPYADLSQKAIREVQRSDSSFYRIEKTFNSVWLAESLAQGYFGVKSYRFQGSSAVRFYLGLGLIPEKNVVPNYINFLPNFKERYALYSLVGVKYMLSPYTLGWPGFSQIGSVGNIRVFRNDLALPLGVVHYRQIPEEEFRRAPPISRDFIMFNGIVTEKPISGLPALSLETLLSSGTDNLNTLYAEPATLLRQGGLVLTAFSQSRFSGRVTATAKGALVLSVPFYPGWTALVDGRPVATFRANLGMTAIELDAGAHQVEFIYRTPGFVAGVIIALTALCVLFATGPLAARLRRRQSNTSPSPTK